MWHDNSKPHPWVIMRLGAGATVAIGAAPTIIRLLRTIMYRTFVILRHTFRESIVQPIYGLLLAIGAVILVVFGMLPFFTLGEDTKMFMSVGLDIILLFVLISTLFATS